MLTGIIIIAFAAFIFAKPKVVYDFKNQVVPLARRYYSELYAFLKHYPLQTHRFTNEFLPFSIAFGLDNSWQSDFGLIPEIAIDNSPMTKKM